MNATLSSERLTEALERVHHHWPARRKAPTAFTIALSREVGAKGSTIASAVGAQLGWPVYDRELLQQIADKMGVRASTLESVDEKRMSWLRECLESFLSALTVSENAYVRRMVETMLSLAAQGDCVIVGRAAAHLLPVDTTLRVRLIGQLPDRIRTIAERFGMGNEEAARWVETTEYERSHFVQDHFHKDPADPRQYDLILNTSRFSVEECTALIIEALRRLQARAAVNKHVAEVS